MKQIKIINNKSIDNLRRDNHKSVQEDNTKPPLGAKPFWVVLNNRMDELSEAILQYSRTHTKDSLNLIHLCAYELYMLSMVIDKLNDTNYDLFLEKYTNTIKEKYDRKENDKIYRDDSLTKYDFIIKTNTGENCQVCESVYDYIRELENGILNPFICR